MSAHPGLAVEGPAAPPRDNGELVFAAPWESRAFGMAAALTDAGAFTWDEFRAHLVAHIAGAPEPFSYYRCWLDALESTLVASGTLASSELTERSEALAARPSGHDHAEHDH